jgi:hypothetical protein
MKISKSLNLIVLFIIVGLFYWGAVNYRRVLDYIAINTIPAGATADVYSKNLQLTDEGRLIFYGTYPKIDEKTEFNQDCRPGKNVLEFGCYYSGANRIFLLNIKSPELSSMVGVGAGHEFLHAVYSRMNPIEKKQMDDLLEENYQKVKDADLDERLNSYAQTEPGNRDNELHSILATEYRNLTPELEKHYQKYFTNRYLVVGWHDQNQTFIKSKEQVLNSQKQKIESEKTRLDQLDAYMEALKKGSKIPEYNTLVPQQNNLVVSLRREIDAFNSNVTEYNDMIASINSHTFSSYDASLIK